jgi:hypothetical protein
MSSITHKLFVVRSILIKDLNHLKSHAHYCRWHQVYHKIFSMLLTSMSLCCWIHWTLLNMIDELKSTHIIFSTGNNESGTHIDLEFPNNTQLLACHIFQNMPTSLAIWHFNLVSYPCELCFKYPVMWKLAEYYDKCIFQRGSISFQDISGHSTFY